MRRFIWVLLFCGLFHGPTASAVDVITWYQPDFPPYVILNPSESHLGIDNRIVGDMIGHLPAYEHHFQQATYRRIMQQMKSGINGVITPLFITEERRRFIRYSQPASYLVMPNTVIVKTVSLPRFQPFLRESQRLDLEAAVRSGSLRFGISDGRSYSGIIDQVINAYRDSGSFTIRSGLNLSTGLLRMLDLERIDAWIAFPVELRFTARQCDIDAAPFTVLRVEGMEPYTPVHFGVPDTPWGRRILQRIDDVLARPGTIARFLNYYCDWLDPASRALYREMVREYYGDDPRQSGK